MLPLIVAACGAAGAVAGVLTTKAAKEKDKQAIKRYEKVNTELINNRDRLQKQYYELSDRSKQQINDLNLKLAESEMEKDLVYLALSLYHELMALREDIDINPSFDILVEFHKAIALTNYVLKQLDKHLVPISQDYFSRTLTRIDERDNLSKEQLFSFMAVLMNPQQDTVTSILGEVQNEIFSQQYVEVEADDINYPNSESEDIVNENSAKFWFQQGEIFFESEEYEKALCCFDRAIAIEPNNDEFWYNLSLSLLPLGRNGESLNAIDKAIEIKPSEDIYWYHQSLCLSELDMNQEALKSLNRAIQFNQNEDNYWYLKSDILCELDMIDEALIVINRAIAINSADALYWTTKAQILYYLEKNDEALESINQALEINHNYDVSWYWRGVILFATKVLLFLDRKKEALESFDRAISINPNNGEYWYWRSRALLDLCKRKEAFDSLERAIAIEPTNDEYRKLRSEIITHWDQI